MADKEWFRVELPNGQSPADLDCDMTLDQAEAAASDYVCETSQTLTVVEYTRREIRQYSRVVTVATKDIASPV